MSKRVSIVGPDKSGKSTLLERIFPAVKDRWEVLDRPNFNGSSSNLVRILGNLSDGMIRVGSRRESKRLVALGAMLNPPLYVLADKQTKRKVTISTIDPWIDVQVYCMVYFPNMMDLVEPLARSFYRPAQNIIYLRTPIDVCLDRLKGEPQLHENEESLKKIVDGYERIIDYVMRHNMSSVFIVDTKYFGEEEVHQKARNYLAHALGEGQVL